jgi:dephospho-CoA kinase
VKRSRAGAGKPIIGLAGGIGSGKTTIASVFAELGAGVISSDRLNHDELDSPEVLAELRAWWGDRVIDSHGKADCRAIREIVGQDAVARRKLEQLVHPRIAARSQALLAAFEADPCIRAIVWDSPLLFEVGLADLCDCIVFVDADIRIRLARVAQERGWSQEDLERFEKLQKPLDFKKERADYIVENNSDIDAVRPQAEGVFSRILSAAKTS